MTATPVYARRLVSLVKLEHTVFALPYAYAGAILAAGQVPDAQLLAWITVAMVGARSLAMALNRLIDAGIDARNPRTARRELPAGLLTPAQVGAFAAASLAVFLVAVWQLPPVTHVLWPIPVAGFVIYPYLKRFTWLCHPFLGAVDGLAPVGGWVAVTGTVDWQAFLLGGAVALWIGGFDIIYATMDLEIDRREDLHSIPRRFGVGTALLVTRIAHAGSVALLIWLGINLGLGPLYWLGLAIVAVLLAYENSIVSEDDLSRVDMAFLQMNGVIAMVFLAGVLADALALRRSSARASHAGSGSVTRSRASTSRSPRARPCSSPAPTAPARPPCCGSSPRSFDRAPAGWLSPAATCRPAPRTSAAPWATQATTRSPTPT